MSPNWRHKQQNSAARADRAAGARRSTRSRSFPSIELRRAPRAQLAATESGRPAGRTCAGSLAGHLSAVAKGNSRAQVAAAAAALRLATF